MVAVVVDERHAPGRRRHGAVHLQPAVDAGELRERALQRRVAISSSAATAIAASEFSTLCSPGRFSSTVERLLAARPSAP